MRFHVVSLPHTQATAEFSACACTMKVIGFCRMMKSLGHTVFLYAAGSIGCCPPLTSAHALRPGTLSMSSAAQYEAYFERLTGLYGDGWGAVAA